MKNALYLLIAILLLTTGCNRPTPTTLCNELLQAEELMYPAPDSALHILQGMTPPADELNRATWALLLTQAKYKCDVAQSDSLVNVAYDFFMKGDDAQRKALALYHIGALYREKNQVDKALPFYLQASEEIKVTKDYQLGHLINIHICLIYVYRKLYQYAEEYCTKAMDYALLANDNYYISHSYLNMARIYSVQADYIKSIECYKKALDIANLIEEQERRNLLISTELTEISNVYIYCQMLTLALKRNTLNQLDFFYNKDDLLPIIVVL